METLRLSAEQQDIEIAGEIIRRGGLVAFPTETVYGLGADALNAEAVRSVYAAKGRPSDNPMIVHIAKMSDLNALIRGDEEADKLSANCRKVMEAFWPGPLTVVFPKSSAVPDATTGGLDTVAVRMPSNETARRLIEAAGTPIAAPSANLSGKPSPTTARDVLEDMDGRIDAIIMGEACDVGIESTVLDMTGENPVILRPGIITKEWISEILGLETEYDGTLTMKPEGQAELADPSRGVADGDFKPKSPGMKYKHYAPNAKVRIIEACESATEIGTDEFQSRAGELADEARAKGLRPVILDYGNDGRRAAHYLFADLREMDRQGYDLILIRALEEEGLGFSVMNRMLKSAGYDVVR